MRTQFGKNNVLLWPELQYSKYPQGGVPGSLISTLRLHISNLPAYLEDWKLLQSKPKPWWTCLFHITLLQLQEFLIGWIKDFKLFKISERWQEIVLKEADSNPYFHGRMKKLEHYLEDRGHEDREPCQQEHKDSGDSLLSGLVKYKTNKNHQKCMKYSTTHCICDY